MCALLRVEEFECGRESLFRFAQQAGNELLFPDQGVGIEEKDFEVIFEKYNPASADTLREKPKGAGLGLPICREIITHYGGNIWAESRKNEGTTFFFTIPVAEIG